MKIEDTIELIGLPKPPDLPAGAPMPEILNKNSFLPLSKQEFIDYVKFFPSMTLEEELLGYYYSYNNGVNDISKIEHSDEEFSLEKVENVEYYWCKREVLTTDDVPNLAYFIFVKIGETKDGCQIGIAFFMYYYILIEIENADNKSLVKKCFYDYCISKEQLSKMTNLV